MSSGIPTIDTRRLHLRGFQRRDTVDVFGYASDPAVLLHTTGLTPRSVEDSQVFVDSMLRKAANSYAWAICVKGKSRVIGAVEFGLQDETEGGIHYALGLEFWNRGLMTEACQAVLAWAFSVHSNLACVTTEAVVENRGSTRVMEKCGMRYQRTVEHTWEKFDNPVQLAVYSIDREQWDRFRDRC